MKLNQATDYAFRMVLHMALLPSPLRNRQSVPSVLEGTLFRYSN